MAQLSTGKASKCRSRQRAGASAPQGDSLITSKERRKRKGEALAALFVKLKDTGGTLQKVKLA